MRYSEGSNGVFSCHISISVLMTRSTLPLVLELRSLMKRYLLRDSAERTMPVRSLTGRLDQTNTETPR